MLTDHLELSARLPCGCEPGGSRRCEEALELRHERDRLRRLAELASGAARAYLWERHHRLVCKLMRHLAGLWP